MSEGLEAGWWEGKRVGSPGSTTISLPPHNQNMTGLIPGATPTFPLDGYSLIPKTCQ